MTLFFLAFRPCFVAVFSFAMMYTVLHRVLQSIIILIVCIGAVLRIVIHNIMKAIKVYKTEQLYTRCHFAVAAANLQL